MAPKRRELGAVLAPLGTGKRPRTATPGGPAEPPPSPGKRLWAAARTVLVVLFFIRGNDGGIGSFPRFGRMLKMIWKRLERMEEQIQNLTHKQDKITRSSPTNQAQQRPRKGINQEGTSVEAKELTTEEGMGENTSIRLRFLNDMRSTVYHDDEIKSQSNTAIKIGIFDGDKIVRSGPLSKLKIEALALEGSFPYGAEDSWTAKEFDEHRAGGRDGKGDVLVGEGTTARLINGECHLGSIRFREGSCRARRGVFLLGVRVCNGQAAVGRIQEAVMSPVIVQDRRNKANEKSHPPKLTDKVHRLEEIAKDGKYFKRLENNNIHTVEDFLKALNKDPDNLAKILEINKEHKPWKRMIRHARQCCLEGKYKLKSYTCAEKNVKLFFNCVHCLVGAAFFGGPYTSCDKYDPTQQALVDELKKDAYAKLDILPEDHVMTNNSQDPIHMDTYADLGAGPSYMSPATQQNCFGGLLADQVGGMAAAEGLIQDQILSFVNVNNGPGPSSSISDYPSIHNYDAGGFTAGEGFNYGPMDSPCSIANDGPGPGFCTPDHRSTYNYHGKWSQIADQNESLALLTAGLLEHEYERSLLNPAATINRGAHILAQNHLSCNGTPQAPISAHIHMQLEPQQHTIYGAPGSAQGNVQIQMQAPLPTNGTLQPSASAQQTLPAQQFSQCPGNRPGNGTL
ncbi:hypothetical protein QOZ80_5AG0393660 [Eleusine coracana subsp. coracana]|nr:hypothetical protein QOZ80_5AG0393660 [Eleusine coracana subsp. coracana]